MQLLFSIPEFRAAILPFEIWEQTNVIDASDTQALQVLQFLFLCMNTKTINSEILKGCYRDLGHKRSQEDCVEFMAKLLGNMEAVLPGSTELFRYDMQTKISPKSQTKVFSQFENVYDEKGMMFHPLSIDPSDVAANTLANVLEQTYSSAEDIENWEVVVNGLRIPAKRSQKITKIPTYMLFQICRFDWEGNKLCHRFDFPFEIDLRPYCADDIGDRTRMELCGIIVHRGDSVKDGHYYALIRNEGGVWVKFNDNFISNVEGNCINGTGLETDETPYVLLYRKI
jgi:uncharacterized UBP type Zn finger protein